MAIKVKMTDNSKKAISCSELPIAKRLMKEANDPACEYALTDMLNIAARYIAGYDPHILESSAEIAKNGRIWNAHFEGSYDLDIWLEFTVYDGGNKFYIVGVYLTDIWNIGGEEDVKRHMYIRKFCER